LLPIITNDAKGLDGNVGSDGVSNASHHYQSGYDSAPAILSYLCRHHDHDHDHDHSAFLSGPLCVYPEPELWTELKDLK